MREIRRQVPNVPFLGFAAIADFLFSGREVPEAFPSTESEPLPVLHPNIKVALLMVSY